MAKEILLTKGYTATVDDADYEWLNQWTWYAEVSKCGKVYARRSVTIPGTLGYYKDGKSKRGRIRMHNLITGVKPTDHADGNGLNNQRLNLRAATDSQNGANQNKRKDNTSGFKGVYWSTEQQKWRVVLQVQRKRYHGGYFSDPQLAHEKYKQMALEHQGEFANFGDGHAKAA